MFRVQITTEVVAKDKTLAEYLRQAKAIEPGRSGGTFVGNRAVAPNELRQYGITLPKGGMIIPDADPQEIKKALKEGAPSTLDKIELLTLQWLKEHPQVNPDDDLRVLGWGGWYFGPGNELTTELVRFVEQGFPEEEVRDSRWGMTIQLGMSRAISGNPEMKYRY